MTNISASPNNRGHFGVPLIERRQGKSSALRMSIDLSKPNTSRLSYANTLPKLETVLSGKELPQREYKRGPTSRMDPEFEELKGFKELGFEFRNGQLTQRVLILLPGLKRLIDHEKNKKILGFQESTLEKLELSSPHAARLELKEYLKLWARYVASTLKSEYEDYTKVSVWPFLGGIPYYDI